MKKAIAILGAILLVVGLGLGWTGRALGGQDRATVRLFGRSWAVRAAGIGMDWGVRSTTVHDASAAIAAPDRGTADAPFSSISLDVDLGSVTIAAGDDYLVDVNYWGDGYQVLWTYDENNNLMIWSESDGVIDGVNRGSDIIVYVPANTGLEFLTVLLDLGDITLAGLAADHVELDVNLGDVVGEGLTVGSSLNVDADLGTVALYGDLGELVEIDADLGDVTLGLSRPAEYYCWYLNAGLGSITVDGHKRGGFSSSVTGGNGDGVLHVDADLGSIQVDFDLTQATAFVHEALSEGTGWGRVPDAPAPPSVPAAPEPPSAPAAPEPPSVPDVPTVEQAG